MIEVRGLTKRYGQALAVDQLSFQVLPGRVTGFLGPNGAGKSTTMRLVLGLDSPDAGTALVNGRPFREHLLPMREVGALLEAKAVHGGRSAYNHLLCLAQSNGLPRSRVREVLGLVGLDEVAAKRARTFSLGMSQRLGLATALLGDPGVLLLDEPANGLDPEGIYWMRQLLRQLAAQGRTVLVSSHLMAEMALTADHLLVVGHGRLLADAPVQEFIAHNSAGRVRVRSPRAGELAADLVGAGLQVETTEDGALEVTGADAAAIGELAARQGIALHELVTVARSLEEVFMDVTRDSVQFAAAPAGVAAGAGAQAAGAGAQAAGAAR